MAPKRRTSTPSAGARSQQAQSTLSFHKQGPNRVTKPGATDRSSKVKKNAAVLDTIPSVVEPSTAEVDLEQPTTAEAAIAEQAASVKAELDPLQKSQDKVEDVLGGRAAVDDTGATGGKSGSGWLSDEESKARSISDAQIKKYWLVKERERKAPRVHQEGLSIQEKLLREWDMSGQYGVSLAAHTLDSAGDFKAN